jgi:hypothetical protein
MAEKRAPAKKTTAPPPRAKKLNPASLKKTDIKQIRIDSDSDDSLAVLRLFMKVYANL